MLHAETGECFYLSVWVNKIACTPYGMIRSYDGLVYGARMTPGSDEYAQTRRGKFQNNFKAKLTKKYFFLILAHKKYILVDDLLCIKKILFCSIWLFTPSLMS